MPNVVRPGLAALALFLLSACSPSYRAQDALNPASPGAQQIATLSWWMFAVSAVILLAVILILGVGISRAWRKVEGRTLATRQQNWMIIGGGVIAPLLAVIALTIGSLIIDERSPSGGGMAGPTIEVWGYRWWWEARYLDSSGKLIATTANEIHVPVGVPVKVVLRSDNVIHSFWPPNLSGKTDLVPGQANEAELLASEAGIYRGQCAEFCGVQHAFMSFFVIAEPISEFRAWLANEARPALSSADPVALRGRHVFEEAGCGTCHSIRGTEAAGGIAPDLTHLGRRLTLAAATLPNTRGNLGGWITDPQRIKPGALMPGFSLPPDDLHALLAYLEGLD